MRIRRVLFYGVVGLFVALCVHWFWYRTPGKLEYYASYLSYPFLKIQAGVTDAVQSWRVRRQAVEVLEHNCQQLQQERDALLGELVALKTAVSYAEDVRELVSFKQSLSCDQAVIAPIVARRFSDQVNEFFIDVGSKQGIELGMVAVYLQFLVGKVVEVYPLYSKVVAVTDKRCKVSAFCADTKTIGIHEGTNNTQKTALTRVSHLNSVKTGDLLISTGEGLIFPRGFGLGRITNCVLADELVYQVEVEPCVDVRTLKYCCIIPKGSSCVGPLTKTGLGG